MANLNAYEIRLKLIEIATSRAVHKYDAELNQKIAAWDAKNQNKLQNKSILGTNAPDIFDNNENDISGYSLPNYPSTDQIIEEAVELYSFVEGRPAVFDKNTKK